jgi:hypothetical protein
LDNLAAFLEQTNQLARETPLQSCLNNDSLFDFQQTPELDQVFQQLVSSIGPEYFTMSMFPLDQSLIDLSAGNLYPALVSPTTMNEVPVWLTPSSSVDMQSWTTTTEPNRPVSSMKSNDLMLSAFPNVISDTQSTYPMSCLTNAAPAYQEMAAVPCAPSVPRSHRRTSSLALQDFARVPESVEDPAITVVSRTVPIQNQANWNGVSDALSEKISSQEENMPSKATAEHLANDLSNMTIRSDETLRESMRKTLDLQRQRHSMALLQVLDRLHRYSFV